MLTLIMQSFPSVSLLHIESLASTTAGLLCDAFPRAHSVFLRRRSSTPLKNSLTFSCDRSFINKL